MLRNAVSPILLVSMALSSPLAAASGYSADIELLRPGFSLDGLPGVDSPGMAVPGGWRVGVLTQYQKRPLVLHEYGNVVGAVVDDRATTHFGFGYEFSDFAGARIVVPAIFQTGGDVPELGADGIGAGDLSLGARFKALEYGPFVVGIRGDFIFPTGSRDAWMGEAGMRNGMGLLVSSTFGPVVLLVDAGVMTRTKLEMEEDFTLGSELIVNSGLRGTVVEDKLWAYGEVLSRMGMPNLLGGGAENAAEGVLGIQGMANHRIQLDLGVGTGLGFSDGYGTTTQRIVVGATYIWPPRDEPPPVVVVEAPPPPPPDIEDDEVIEKEQEWKKDELARVVDEQIEIRDPIQFEFNTARILPGSKPTLIYVADLLNKNDRIGHLLIEGHASEEGSYVYNYDLSIRRARAIWEELVVSEVHPGRMSYRGMGEVEPEPEGGEPEASVAEATLAKNRRVRFHIIRQYGQLELVPEYPTEIRLPWSGELAQVSPPPPSHLPPVPVLSSPPPGEMLPEGLDLFGGEDDDFEDEDSEDEDSEDETSGDEQPDMEGE